MKQILIGEGADPAVMVRTIVLAVVVGRLLSAMEISPMDEGVTMAVSGLVAWGYDRGAVWLKKKIKKIFAKRDWAWDGKTND